MLVKGATGLDDGPGFSTPYPVYEIYLSIESTLILTQFIRTGALVIHREVYFCATFFQNAI